ncbi:MAG: 1-phosphofructokinase [Clostridia bacterium]|jgi:tagatose 6-phosphate kinase|nr:1-phosphofructokinase [Clostridia bacterium]
MIATITLNPSVDICYYMDSFVINDVNRCSNYIKTAGGKGINVSKVLKSLGSEVIATGFLGGSTGSFIEEELLSMSINPSFVKINDATRNCIAVISEGKQTEILETGPQILSKDSKSLMRALENILESGKVKVVAASGSIPEGLGKDYYNELIKIAKKKNVKFVMDTSADYLKESIKVSPFLIKPNINELENFFDIKIKSEQELKKTMQYFKEYDIDMIVVSIGSEGSIALCGDNFYRINIPRVSVKSPVGSGDALVAGMVREIDKDSSYEEILRVGNTCGILNAMNEKTGSIDMRMFDEIYGKVKIEMLK